MKLIASVKVSSSIPSLLASGPWFGLEFVDAVAAEVVKLAREAVAPGKGPGPHPHKEGWEHNDTGALMRAITYEVEPPRGGKDHTAIVYVRDDPGEGDTPPAEYGLFLEVGWVTPAGNTIRYPWLAPAAHEAAREWEALATARISRHMVDMAGRLHRVGGSRRSS